MILQTPEFLSELFRAIIIMSIVGSIVTLLLFLIKPIVKNRLPKSAQYYLWIVVLAVLLVPLSNIIALPADVGPGVNVIHNVVERNVISTDEARNRQLMGMDVNNAHMHTLDPMLSSRTIVEVPPESSPGLFAQVSTALMLLYPLMVLLILMITVASYIRFTAKVRRFNIDAEWIEKAILRDIAVSNNIKHTPRLYRNTFVTTPMLIGLFKPVIILPDKEYTEKQLNSILLHEVIHFRRLDIIIKWVSLLACAVHWFNPIVWMARREISRACELSCDEAVISNMDNHAKQNYGETLICVAGDAKTPLTVLSTTMCEEKRELKERLAAIMDSKKYTKLAVLASIVVILMVTLVACTLGAGSSPVNENNRSDSIASNYPRTIQTYVDQYIDNLAQGLNVGVFPYGIDEDYFYVRPANIIDTHINLLEKEAEFDNILDHPIELWRLDFMLLTDDLEDGYLRWGTFSPDADGWVGQHSAWNDARTLLVFTRNGDEVEFLGSISWWKEETTYGLEGALHTFLEQQGITVLWRWEESTANALESIAGVWTGMGLFLELHADGTWDGNTGDTGWRGNIEMTREEDGSYTVELIAIDITGPGGMFDNYGNMREEVPAIMEAIEAGEYDWWLPLIDGPFTLLIGTYSFKGDRFTSYDVAGNLQQMERWPAE